MHTVRLGTDFKFFKFLRILVVFFWHLVGEENLIIIVINETPKPQIFKNVSSLSYSSIF